MRKKLKHYYLIGFFSSLSCMVGNSNSLYANLNSLKTKTEISQQQMREISGKVIDQNGIGIPGATIILPGTNYGTTSDFDGNFRIRIPSNTKKILIKYVGMKDAEVVVTKISDNYIVTLEEDVIGLDEVIAIGYGSTKKEDLSMAVSTVKLDEVTKSRPSTLSSVIQGSMPGVSLQSNGGDPMAGVELNIRGRGSRGNDQVLFIVDGVPNAPFSIEDVASISVLKDAASAAIYGSSVGSGGVIIVTTKKAKEGDLSIDVNTSYGFSSVYRLLETTTSEEYNQAWKDATAYFPRRKVPTVADPTKFPYGTETRTNWLKEIFRLAEQKHYAVSVSGGVKKIKAIASIAYDSRDGVLLNTYKKELNAKLSTEFQLTDYLNISERISYNYNWGQGNLNTTNHEGVLMSAIFFPRSATKYDHYGKEEDINKNGDVMYDRFGNPLYGGTIPRRLADKVSGFGELRNPLATLERVRQYRPNSIIYSTTGIKLEPFTDFIINSDFTAGLNISRYEDFTPKVLEPGRPNNENSRSISNEWVKNWLWETTVSYEKTIRQNHKLSFLAGFSKRYDQTRYDSKQANDFDRENPHYTIFENAKKYNYKPVEDIYEEALLSFMSRVGYVFQNKYFINASVRRDATSKLYKNNNYGVFPAVSASWKISEENFFQPLKPVFSFLKFRGSWGQVGSNALVPRYSYVSALVREGYTTYLGKDLSNEIQGQQQDVVPNLDLTWETTEQIGFGIDFGFFNNKLSGTIDYFDKTTKNLIEKLKVSATSGTEAPYGNVGEVSNKGWETSLKFQHKIGNIDFNIYGNFSIVDSKVLDLGFEFMTHDDIKAGAGIRPLRSAPGQPWYSYYLYKTNGIFQTEDEIDEYVYKNPETGKTRKVQPFAKPGDIKYVDVNNDGTINESDKLFMGNYLPKINYGFGFGLNGYGFDFSMFFQGVSGVEIYNGFRGLGLNGARKGHNMLAEVMDSWEYNKNSGIPRLGLLTDWNGNYEKVSDFFLEDGSYLRIKNITLGYSIPKSVMKKVGAPKGRIRFYVNGENIFTFTKYSGFDPEVGHYGVDGGSYPVPRTWSFGVNFNL